MSDYQARSLIDDVSKITELNDIIDFMNDPVIDEAMHIVVKLSVKEQVPPATIAPLITKIQALAVQCSLKGKFYMVFEKGGDAAKRKGTYLTMAKGLDDLTQALKYQAKTGT